MVAFQIGSSAAGTGSTVIGYSTARSAATSGTGPSGVPCVSALGTG